MPELSGSYLPSPCRLWRRLSPTRTHRCCLLPGLPDPEASQRWRPRLCQRRVLPSRRAWRPALPSRRCLVRSALLEPAGSVALPVSGRPRPRTLNLDLPGSLRADYPRRLRCRSVRLPDRLLPRSRLRLRTSPYPAPRPGFLYRRPVCPSRWCPSEQLGRPIRMSSSPEMTIRESIQGSRPARAPVELPGLPELEELARLHPVEPVPDCSSHYLRFRLSDPFPSLPRRSWLTESSSPAETDPSPAHRRLRVVRCRFRPSRFRLPVPAASSSPGYPGLAGLVGLAGLAESPVRGLTMLSVRHRRPVPARRSARRSGEPVGTMRLERDPVP